MKDKIFHYFGNIIEQSPLRTTSKLSLFFKLDLFLFIFSQFNHRFLRRATEFRISQDFMKYMYKHDIDINKRKLILLKKGLDKQSNLLIEDFIKRQKHIYTHNVADNRLFTKEELIQQHINIYPIKRKYRGLSNYYGIENFYFHCGLRFIARKILKKYEQRDLIDAGASNGDTAAIFSREYAFKTIYAFEPEHGNYASLVRNIAKFDLQNVVPVNMGLGDKKTRTRITSEEGQSRISSSGKQTIDMITIDEYVAKNKISVGLIKMDVEGYEYYALKGALRTIRTYHPILLLSIYHTGRDFFEIKPLLEKLGLYRFMVRKVNPYHYFFDTMLICLPGE